MIRTIDKSKNHILFPIDALLKKVVDYLFKLLSLICPSKYRIKIERLNTPAINNVLGLTIFNALGGLLMIVTNIKLANVLGASIFGLYSYYLAIGEVGSNWVRYGMHKTMVRDLIQYPDNTPRTICNTTLLSVINLVVFILITLLFHSKLDFQISCSALLLILAPTLISLDLQPVYESCNLMSWHSIYYLIQKILFLLSIWVIILFRDNVTLLSLSILLFLSWLVIVLLQYKEIYCQYSLKFVKNVSLLSLLSLYKTNFLIALCCFIGVAFGPLIRLILKQYVDSSAVGIFSAAFQIYLVSQFILHQVSRVGNPIMAEFGKPGSSRLYLRQSMKKYLFVMLLSAVPFCLCLVLFPGFIANHLFSSEYSQLISILPYFGFYLIAMAVRLVYEQLLISMRKDKYYFSIYVSGAILTIVVSLLLIPRHGLGGSVIAFTVPGILTRIFYVVFGEIAISKSND